MGAALGLLATGSILTSAKADDTVYDADVGGGVAGIQAIVTAGSPLLNTINKDYAEVTVVTPRVILPSDGGSFHAGALNKKVGPVSVKALSETISGSRTGIPSFATAESALAGVNIPGTNIAALDVTCTWDRDGAAGATTVTDIAGKANKPAPNTSMDVAGLGTLILNEQFFDGVYRADAASSTGYTFFPQVIFVYGAHLYLSKAAQEQYGVVDVILGFTSCDPVQLPSLSGLKVAQNVS
jgi:hypothetical protein